MKTPASAPPLAAALLAHEGYAVFEPATDGALAAVGPLPEWFLRTFGPGAATRFVPAEASPFLDNFLADAEAFWQSGAGGRADSGEWIERDASGRELALEAAALLLEGRRIVIVRNPQARFDDTSHMLQTARDAQLEHERLLREIQTKEILLHCIVHDLSQPLTALRGCLSLLGLGLPAEKLKEVVEIADRQTRKQETMIRDILKAFSSELAALQARGPATGPPPDMAQCAREVVREYAAAFSSQGAQLALDARLETPVDAPTDASESPDRWRVAGDAERLRRIFTNLLENALRYSPAGTTTTVGIEEEGNFLRAFVDDQGPGLPEGVNAGTLFRLFGKGKESTGKAGLGLYFCRITAERWGGSVGCENRAQGGTRFWFRLPRTAAPQIAAAGLQTEGAPVGGVAAQGVAGDAKAASKLRILVADDIEVNRTIATELLTRRGHEVAAVAGGAPAVAAFREQPFDVVLLDVEMDDMGGLDAARAIRALEKGAGRRARILAITAHSEQRDYDDCLRAGMDGRILKPFDVETLYRDVEEGEGGGRAASGGAPPEPGKEAQHATAAESPRERLLARFGGDSRLLGTLTRMFLRDSPRLLAAVRRDVKRRDAAALALSAHALKGAVGHFGTGAAHEAAARLEAVGRCGDLRGASGALDDLAAEMEALRRELASLSAARPSRRKRR